MTQINWCLEILRLAPATIIGAAVAYVAWRQWMTANAKLKLELFERRWLIYQRVAQKFKEFHIPNRNPIDDLIEDMEDLILEMPFLFGREITTVVNEWIELARTYDFLKHDPANRNANDQINNNAQKELNELRPRIRAKVQEFSNLCTPYMDMT